MKNIFKLGENNSRNMAQHQKQWFKTIYNALNGGIKSWYISVSWKEPDENMVWKNFTSKGPFNENFFRWLDQHWDYWQNKANVSVEPEGFSREPMSGGDW